MTPKHLVIALLALATVAPALGQPAPEPTPAFSATYRVARVSVGSSWVELDFRARLSNIGGVEADIRSIRLASPSSADTPFATFDGTRLPARGRADIAARVTIPILEWQRWENGGPATLFVFVQRSTADLGRTRVEARREASSR